MGWNHMQHTSKAEAATRVLFKTTSVDVSRRKSASLHFLSWKLKKCGSLWFAFHVWIILCLIKYMWDMLSNAWTLEHMQHHSSAAILLSRGMGVVNWVCLLFLTTTFPNTSRNLISEIIFYIEFCCNWSTERGTQMTVWHVEWLCIPSILWEIRAKHPQEHRSFTPQNLWQNG